MSESQPYFKVALNLPHAGRIARRILLLVPEPPSAGAPSEVDSAHRIAAKLEVLLATCLERDENPPGPAAAVIREQAAALGRTLVDRIEREKAGSDRLGQCVRNLFECLELGQEGAAISLRAGEDPKSFQRPF